MPHRSTHIQVRSGNPSATGADTSYEAEFLVDSRDHNLKFYENGAERILASTGVAVSGQAVVAKTVTFAVGAAAAGVYTGSVVVPAGGTVIDIIVDGITLWNSGTSATLKVGDTDDDGYYTAVDMKATDLLAGESISFALAGGKAGAYIANSQVSPRYSAAAHTISGILTTVGTTTTGLSRMTVVYSAPASADITAATYVAS